MGQRQMETTSGNKQAQRLRSLHDAGEARKHDAQVVGLQGSGATVSLPRDQARGRGS